MTTPRTKKYFIFVKTMSVYYLLFTVYCSLFSAERTNYKPPFDVLGEKIVFEFNKEPQDVLLYISNDGNQCAVSYRDDTGQNVEIGTEKFGPYSSASEFCFSPDGSQYFFWIYKDDQWILNNNGSEKTYSIINAVKPTFSKNGNTYAFIGFDPNRIQEAMLQIGSNIVPKPYFLVVNGKIVGEYEKVDALELSSDGTEYGIIKTVIIKEKKEPKPKPEKKVEKKEKKDIQEKMTDRMKRLQDRLEKLEKDKEEKKDDDETKEREESYVVINGKEVGPLEAVILLKNINNKWLFVAKENGQWKIFGGKAPDFKITPLAVNNDESLVQFTVSDNGSSYAYAVQKPNGKTTVYLKSEPKGTYDGVSLLQLSPTGKRFSYVANVVDPNGQEFKSVFIDGKKIDDGEGLDKFDAVAPPGTMFSKDEQHYGVVTKIFGKWYAIVDGKKSDGLDGEFAGGFEFSKTGSRYAFMTFTPTGVKEGEMKYRISIDGKQVLLSGSAPFSEREIDIDKFKEEHRNQDSNLIKEVVTKTGLDLNKDKTVTLERIKSAFEKLVNIPNFVQLIDDYKNLADAQSGKPDTETIIKNKIKLAKLYPLTLEKGFVTVDIKMGSSLFSPDGTSYVLGTKAEQIKKKGKKEEKESKWAVIVNDRTGPYDWSSISNPVYSDDGKRFVYLAYKNKTVYRIVEKLSEKK